MILLAVLLAASPGLVVLSQKSQVKDLCKALRAQPADGELDPAQEGSARKEALLRHDQAASLSYQVEVPAKGFRFGRYRDRLLELDGDRPLRALDNVLYLDIEGIDEVTFEASPEQVSAFTAAQKAGTLRLLVVFKPNGDRCAGSAAAESWRIAGSARSWKIEDETGVVAAADAEGDPVAQGPRKLKVQKVAVDSDADEPDDEGRTRLAGVHAQLERCAATAQRSGKLVLGFDVRGGRVQDPQVMLDSLRDERIAGCVARAVDGAAVGGSGRGTASISLE